MSSKRRSMTQVVKRRAKEAPNGKWGVFWNSLDTICHYCEGEMFVESQENKLSVKERINRRTFDHIVCRVIGGKDDPSNLVACCDICNVLKGQEDYLEFAIFAHFELIPLRKETKKNFASFKGKAAAVRFKILGKR